RVHTLDVLAQVEDFDPGGAAAEDVARDRAGVERRHVTPETPVRVADGAGRPSFELRLEVLEEVRVPTRSGEGTHLALHPHEVEGLGRQPREIELREALERALHVLRDVGDAGPGVPGPQRKYPHGGQGDVVAEQGVDEAGDGPIASAREQE